MEKVKNAINWFEIPVSDFERAKKFYTTIMEFEMHEEQMPDGKLGFLPFDMEEKGAVGGAIAKGEGFFPSHHGVKVYLNGGKDLNTILNRVVGAGGKVTLPKMKISDEIGYIGRFLDSEGNEISLHSK